MEKINFTGMTGAQAFRAIDANGGVNDDDISANMEAWAGASFVNFFNNFDSAQLVAAVKKLGNVSASYASTLAGHLQSCTKFDPELISEAAEQLVLQDKEINRMAEKIKALEAELEAVGAGGVQPLRNPNASLNQKMLEALRATVAEDESLIEECKRQGHLLPDDMLVIYRQCKAAIAQAEAQQVQPPLRKQNIDALRAAIKNGTAHADGDCEAKWIESTDHLNCPACGGSGHVDDVKQPVRELLTDDQTEEAMRAHQSYQRINWETERTTSDVIRAAFFNAEEKPKPEMELNPIPLPDTDGTIKLPHGWKLHRCPDSEQCRDTVAGGCAFGWCSHFKIKAEQGISIFEENQSPETCRWTCVAAGAGRVVYRTKCNSEMHFDDGVLPSDCDQFYCHHCGKKIEIELAKEGGAA